MAADLQGSIDDFVSRGLVAPRLFAFPDSAVLAPSEGRQVSPALRGALFGRFRAALVDVAPAAAHVGGSSPYVPRVVPGAMSPARLVAAIDTAAGAARRGRSPLAQQRRAVEGWSAAVNGGDFERAADFFAPGAVVEQTNERLLTSRLSAVEFNRRLPCRAQVEDVRDAGAQTLADFRLLPGRSGGCAGGGRARVRLVMRGGQFLEWRQVVAPGGAELGAALRASG